MASKSSVSTDAAAIEELLTRGVADVYPSTDALRAAVQSGKKLRIYNGIDPTAATLHIGHLASLQKLRQFQTLGHEIIMLIGDFTGMIGDPTGKHSARQQLTRAQVLANARAYRTQASSVLRFTGRNAAKIKRNGSWWNRMTSLRFLELLSLTTAQRLLERDMFQERIKAGAPVGAHELLYPALQGYDSAAMHVDVEIGGTDQTFNMLMGREYVRKLEDREKFVITVPLLADANGKKIGKSEGNMVELGAMPEDLFGQAMALPDGVIVSCFAQCTSVPAETVIRVRDRLAAGENPRDAKMELATEFVRMRYGAKAADRAREAFVRTFQQHEVPEEVAVMSLNRLGLSGSVPLAMLLVKVGFAASVSEARRLIEQGGVKIDGEVFRVPNAMFDLDGHEKGVLLQKGKRHFLRVVGNKK
ncbi:tyrosine--tRNA ligase [Candidatus Uhrbacteria bacterium]|nr:tyrosine--tRNA ligase [Candidatus Uhrbacteria bacterium]